MHSDDIISCIRRAYVYNFPSVFPESDRFKLNVQPVDRLARVISPGAEDLLCGGFVVTYQSLADYYGVPVHHDMCWDIENLYRSSRTFDLSKFTAEYEQPLKESDLLPVLHALRYNTYFTALIIKNLKLEKKEVVVAVAELLKHNQYLDSVTLSGVTTGVKDGFTMILDSLSANPLCALSKIHISDSTSFDDKTSFALQQWLKKTNKK
jgi:hypothetical protein